VLIGGGATALSDLWGMLVARLTGVPGLDYRMIGRWLGHMPRGRFFHNGIAKAAPVRGEAPLGWAAHYAIGIAFAALLLAIWGLDWGRRPTPGPAIIIGVATLAAPFFIMQPAFGAGIAASRTPRPNIARLRSLALHLVFGLGLYFSALVTASVFSEGA
jgi:hypothetical protein